MTGEVDMPLNEMKRNQTTSVHQQKCTTTTQINFSRRFIKNLFLL